jgi:uncharacterized protein with PQ loop repeat
MVPFTVIGAIAGTVATLMFVGSALPMLIRAHRTRDLSSYSPANLIIANIGNLAQTLYVLTVPPGPLWALHGFNVIASALMLLWWLRHHGPRRRSRPTGTSPPTFAYDNPNHKELPDDHSDHRSDRNRRPLARL